VHSHNALFYSILAKFSDEKGGGVFQTTGTLLDPPMSDEDEFEHCFQENNRHCPSFKGMYNVTLTADSK
jgi:hypothetical protein